MTGKVISSDAESLEIDSEFMGRIQVKWEAVAEIESEEKLYVTSEDGQTLVGPVRTDGESFRVETTESGVVAVPMASVAAVRNETAQRDHEAEIERLRNPKLTDFWRGFVDTNLALTAGNASTQTFSNAAGATREGNNDVIKIYFTSVFAENTTLGDTVRTANAVRGGSRYELDVSEKMFTFGFVDLEFDEFQALDLRNVLGGGFGYRAVRSGRMRFDVFGGASFNQEFFQEDITRRSAELVLGEEFAYRLNERASLTQRLALYPNLSETGEYRLQFDTSLTTDIFRWLGWNVTFSDRFLSNPVLGRQRNDVLLTTGVRIVFGDEKLR